MEKAANVSEGALATEFDTWPRFPSGTTTGEHRLVRARFSFELSTVGSSVCTCARNAFSEGS